MMTVQYADYLPASMVIALKLWGSLDFRERFLRLALFVLYSIESMLRLVFEVEASYDSL